jgi:hypothetical protein
MVNDFANYGLPFDRRTKISLLHMYLPDLDFHPSGLLGEVEFDMRVSGKNLGENRLKIAGCTVIALLEAFSGA